MEASLFRTLSPEEEREFRQWARENYSLLEEIKEIWHPVVQNECQRMNAESIDYVPAELLKTSEQRLIERTEELNRVQHLLDLYAETLAGTDMLIAEIIQTFDDIKNSGHSLNSVESQIHVDLVKCQESRQAMDTWGKGIHPTIAEAINPFINGEKGI